MTASHPDNHAAWRALFSELGACLFDDSRSRQQLQPLGQAARAEKVWPTTDQSDEYLLAAVLRLSWTYAGAGPRRRAVLAPAILAVLREAEALVWMDQGLMAGAPVGPFAEEAAPIRAPEEGDPLFRRDIHS